jgi:hypothetical protein
MSLVATCSSGVCLSTSVRISAISPGDDLSFGPDSPFRQVSSAAHIAKVGAIDCKGRLCRPLCKGGRHHSLLLAIGKRLPGEAGA